MIYLDTSVALAHLLSEDRRPPTELWHEDLVSSRLLEYEIFTRINSRGLSETHSEAARHLVSLVSVLEMAPPILERVLSPFPVPVRTLDAIHLASMLFLKEKKQRIEIASYDDRLTQAALALGFPEWSAIRST